MYSMTDFPPISIHALRVEGDSCRRRTPKRCRISIHALRVEGDALAANPDAQDSLFLSTPSGWRATAASAARPPICPHFYPRPPGGGRLHADCQRFGSLRISIHALRVEGDHGREDRRAHAGGAFLSTPSGWRATVKAPLNGIIGLLFLSTPSGWRATLPSPALRLVLRNFYPRPPGGGRPSRFSNS